jgi:hypothetical protein
MLPNGFPFTRETPRGSQTDHRVVFVHIRLHRSVIVDGTRRYFVPQSKSTTKTAHWRATKSGGQFGWWKRSRVRV